ncbi:MAG: amidohydrolase family protein [bacterium]|nr:amidohydrolase family protein [bacterium]
MYNIIIKNGTIIDGTGKKMFSGDVGIREEKIEEIGDLQNEKADIVIDARNQYVAPGFIDVNNHSDTYWRIFLEPDLPSLIYQGITTIIGGNCGSSLAPLFNQDILQTIQKWADIRLANLNWLSMKDFLKETENRKIAVNFGTLVGHATLRRGILGDEVRNLTEQELKTMKKSLEKAMKEGALGLSTGLVYTHAKLASREEIIELAKVVKKYDGVYATHIRGEGGELLEAVKEALEIARISKVNLHISHLKAIGRKNWPLQEEAIKLIEKAKKEGITVSFDVYPYTLTGSVLYILLPDWVAEGGKRMMIRRLKDPVIRQKLIKEMKEDGFDYSKVIISISPLDKTLNKKKIIDLAKNQGKSVEETIIDILIASEGRVITMMDVLSEKNIASAISHPLSIISTNGSGYSIGHRNSKELVHPRNFGTFARVFAKYVKGKKLMSFEEAVYKMSGKPAEKFGLKNRGVIKKGNFADVVVFDPKKIKDLATPENPYQYPEGIGWVVVNGKVALENGKSNGVRGGEVIRKRLSIF